MLWDSALYIVRSSLSIWESLSGSIFLRSKKGFYTHTFDLVFAWGYFLILESFANWMAWG